MERKISYNDVKKALDDAYESVKSLKEGIVDPRNIGADAKDFAITVALADGTVISKGDSQVKAPMGSIAKVGLSSLLFSQNKVEEVIKKSGQCPCHKVEKKPKHLGFSAHGIRAFSALEPVGDPESKWNLFEGRMIDLMGSAPELDIPVYQNLRKEAEENNVVNELAEAGYYLYDDAALALDLYLKALSMKASTEQLAMMGATIAADGVNPATGKVVYDGAISQNIVGLMAAKGPHKMNGPWLVAAGLPAKSSFGGTIVGVYPGVMAVAAYSPELNAGGVSVKAARVITEFMRRLDLSVFGSARVQIVKE